MKYDDRRATISMHIKKGRRIKNYSLSSHGTGKAVAAIEVLSPPRDKGMKILKKNKNIWIFLPSIERIQKISGHMLQQGMLGSDMSYEDMMTATTLEENYTAELLGEVSKNGKSCFKIIFMSKTNHSPYHKRISYIDQFTFVPVYEELYSDSGMLLKTWQFEDVKEYNGRQFPTKMIVNDTLQTNSTTTIVFTNLEFNVSIPPEHFNRRWLNR